MAVFVMRPLLRPLHLLSFNRQFVMFHWKYQENLNYLYYYIFFNKIKNIKDKNII